MVEVLFEGKRKERFFIKKKLKGNKNVVVL